MNNRLCEVQRTVPVNVLALVDGSVKSIDDAVDIFDVERCEPLGERKVAVWFSGDDLHERRCQPLLGRVLKTARRDEAREVVDQCIDIESGEFLGSRWAPLTDDPPTRWERTTGVRTVRFDVLLVLSPPRLGELVCDGCQSSQDCHLDKHRRLVVRRLSSEAVANPSCVLLCVGLLFDERKDGKLSLDSQAGEVRSKEPFIFRAELKIAEHLRVNEASLHKGDIERPVDPKHVECEPSKNGPLPCLKALYKSVKIFW